MHLGGGLRLEHLHPAHQLEQGLEDGGSIRLNIRIHVDTVV